MDIIQNMEERIETLIFLSKDELSIEELAKFYDMEKENMMELLLNLKEKRKISGINIKIENGIVALVSNPLYGEDVRRFFNPEMKMKKLTKSAMETLAIIAYKGPITKGEIESIRGVGVEKTMANLLEKNLVFVSGKRKSIGTPNLYQVTEDFYSYLNIDKEENLPGYEEFRKINLLTQKSAVSDDDIEVPATADNNENNILKENEENNEIK